MCVVGSDVAENFSGMGAYGRGRSLQEPLLVRQWNCKQKTAILLHFAQILLIGKTVKNQVWFAWNFTQINTTTQYLSCCPSLPPALFPSYLTARGKSLAVLTSQDITYGVLYQMSHKSTAITRLWCIDWIWRISSLYHPRRSDNVKQMSRENYLPSVCLSVRPSVRPSVCLSVCLSIRQAAVFVHRFM